MGEITKLSCKKCGFNKEVSEGCGETACVTNLYCIECDKVSSFWESHGFGDYQSDLDFLSDKPKEEPKAEEIEKPKSCKSCKNLNLVPVDSSEACPKCGAKKIKSATLGHWD